MLLNKINSPEDLKKLTIEELYKLSDEISQYIHDVVSDLGGHYSSPLGVVDLTLALNYVYSPPFDKIIWDVGHQAYAHKIITGRRDAFKKLRQKEGISGFLKIDESEYDAFGAGHASTSISAALGFAHERDFNKEKNQVLSIIGDGSMTGGLAYEGLNNLGYHRTQMTVILNDNSLSISKSVGALSKYLMRISTNPTYNKLRNELWNISGKIPNFSKHIRSFIKKTEGSVKAYLTPGSFFEELGLRYIGPINGHDIDEMIKVFNSVKTMNTPVLLHIYTDKSKKILQPELDAVKYYSLKGVKNKSSNKNNNNCSFSSVLGESLSKFAPKYNFKCITAAMELGTGISKFAQNYKDRYIDVGIAEGHAVTYAAGISASRKLPIVPIYSTFMQRAFDNIVHDFALQKLPGIFCMDRAGLVGNDGPTHHGVFDISFMRSIPRLIVAAPKNGDELYDLLYTGINRNLFMSIRYPKTNTVFNNTRKPEIIKIGSWEKIVNGNDLCILATGSMVEIAEKSVNELCQKYNIKITLINARFIKPLDEEMLMDIALKYNYIYTIEEGLVSGGFGSSILEFYSKKKVTSNIVVKGIDNEFTEHGTRAELLRDLNLDYESITKDILNILNNEKK